MSDTDRAVLGTGETDSLEGSTSRPEDVPFWHAFRHPTPAGPAFDDAPVEPAAPPRRAKLRWLFPAIWLVFLVDPIASLARKGGAGSWIAIVLIVLFAVGYALALPAAWGGRRRQFTALFVAEVALTVAVLPFAREGTITLLVFVAVLLVAGYRRWALLGIAVLTAASVALPVAAGWLRFSDAIENVIVLPLVAMAMFGFFSLLDVNRALAAARTEVVRLAAENERTRIARDLHDLLGHSLTTITVKVGLARKLAEREGAEAAAAELADTEAVARRALREVRAAVSGYTEVTLAGELATARAVLRAAGMRADLPGAVDAVDPVRSELFGWVVREGVTNVVRHSRAQTCRIELGPTWVEVVDDGSGVPPAQDPSGHGLSGLRERVEAVGGTLTAGAAEPGWRLRVEVPA